MSCDLERGITVEALTVCQGTCYGAPPARLERLVG
jgi:hypothetical protein